MLPIPPGSHSRGKIRGHQNPHGGEACLQRTISANARPMANEPLEPSLFKRNCGKADYWNSSTKPLNVFEHTMVQRGIRASLHRHARA